MNRLLRFPNSSIFSSCSSNCNGDGTFKTQHNSSYLHHHFLPFHLLCISLKRRHHNHHLYQRPPPQLLPLQMHVRTNTRRLPPKRLHQLPPVLLLYSLQISSTRFPSSPPMAPDTLLCLEQHRLRLLLPAVESLSKLLNLSPAIAGTTLLPLGNGSPDVFASIISFTASGDGGAIGLNSILGGAIFVSTVVVGVLSLLLCYHRKIVIVDKPNFIRDVVFLLFSLSNLLVIILIGKINFWASILFASTYIIYICLVSYMHFISKKKQRIPDDDHHQGPRLPLLVSSADKLVPRRKSVTMLLLYVIALPLYLPRRLTIPLITQEKWSKPFAIISVVLAPVMLALILSTTKATMVTCSIIALVVGFALGTCTFLCTSSTMPPQKYLFIWYASGFLMSVIWTYIIAKELVSLLESLGTIIGMKPSILGLTILAWGNSLGDLTSNVAMAMHDGPHGA